MAGKDLRHFRFRDVKIHAVDFEEIHRTVAKNVNNTGYICLTCVHTLMDALRDVELREAINCSLLSIPDGTPLAWYGKLLGFREVQRTSGPVLLKRLLEEQNGFRHFLLGDTDRTLGKVITKARRVRRDIQIGGYSPPFKPEFAQDDNQRIFDRIERDRPDLIWVGLGGGKQDKWMYRNVHKLEHGIMIGVGAAFRYYVGEIRTPPRILQSLGLQWLFRMLDEPVRVGKGQLSRFPKFMAFLPVELWKYSRQSAAKRGGTVWP